MRNYNAAAQFPHITERLQTGLMRSQVPLKIQEFPNSFPSLKISREGCASLVALSVDCLGRERSSNGKKHTLFILTNQNSVILPSMI